MRVHANAKLGPAGRLALVRRVVEGGSLRSRRSREFCFGCHGASVVASLARRRRGAARERSLAAGSLQPAASPAATSQRRARGADLRGPRGDRLGAAAGRRRDRPAALDGLEGAPRHGLSRRPRAERGAPNRYEWPCPGDLLHMDVCSYARFRRPGHRATGDRSQRDRHWMHPETRVGYDYAHAIVDDHSRLAYVELHDDERAATVTAFLERALVFFAAHGITTAPADDRQRVHLHQEPLAARATRRPRHPPPHHPALPAAHQRQGRALPPNHGPRMGPRPQLPHQHARASLLGDWLEHYNHRRPHSAIGNRAPITRVHNL